MKKAHTTGMKWQQTGKLKGEDIKDEREKERRLEFFARSWHSKSARSKRVRVRFLFF